MVFYGVNDHFNGRSTLFCVPKISHRKVIHTTENKVYNPQLCLSFEMLILKKMVVVIIRAVASLEEAGGGSWSQGSW